MAGMYGFAQDAPQTPPRRSQMAPAYVDEPMPVPSRAFQVSQASQLGRQLKRPPHAAPGAFLEASGPEAVVGIVQESFNRWLRDISSEGNSPRYIVCASARQTARVSVSPDKFMCRAL
ncbi:unnamed protein product [Effrenium voratum]|nr:unnamed protein product [Effrenium voratum]